jgi:hypothetical protein
MSKRTSYIDRMEKQLKEWDKELNKLLMEVSRKKDDIKIEYRGVQQKIEARRADALKHLNDLKDSGEDSWEELKNGFENSWKELRSSIERAKSKFK